MLYNDLLAAMPDRCYISDTGPRHKSRRSKKQHSLLHRFCLSFVEWLPFLRFFQARSAYGFSVDAKIARLRGK
jgi:hypothetical protein